MIVIPHAQRERGKVIGAGVHIFVYMFVDEKNICYRSTHLFKLSQ